MRMEKIDSVVLLPDIKDEVLKIVIDRASQKVSVEYVSFIGDKAYTQDVPWREKK